MGLLVARVQFHFHVFIAYHLKNHIDNTYDMIQFDLNLHVLKPWQDSIGRPLGIIFRAWLDQWICHNIQMITMMTKLMMMKCFYLNDWPVKVHQVLSPLTGRVITRDSHLFKSPSCHKQDMNLDLTQVLTLLNKVAKQ